MQEACLMCSELLDNCWHVAENFLRFRNVFTTYALDFIHFSFIPIISETEKVSIQPTVRMIYKAIQFMIQTSLDDKFRITDHLLCSVKVVLNVWNLGAQKCELCQWVCDLILTAGSPSMFLPEQLLNCHSHNLGYGRHPVLKSKVMLWYGHILTHLKLSYYIQIHSIALLFRSDVWGKMKRKWCTNILLIFRRQMGHSMVFAVDWKICTECHPCDLVCLSHV